MSATLVDTGKVSGRRVLHFNSVDDILADAERLGRAKSITTLGNWGAAQIFRHLAIAMTGAMDGFTMHVPWLFRIIIRFFMKSRMLKKGMPAGYKIGAKTQKILYPDSPVTLEEGLQALRTAIQRWKTDPKRAAASPFLGPMTDEEWTKLQCRHAELHLSFLKPEE